jgi:Cu-processing system ATP-binding protein
MTAHVHFAGLSKAFGSSSALSHVELAVARGSVLALLGPNGAGKSTLFGCLVGLTRPSSGQVLLGGGPVSDSARLTMGYLPERPAFYPHRTAAENACFFAGLKGVAREEVDAQLDRVGLRGVRRRKARALSKGMLQRLGWAVALCGRPELLVLDEPFNGLDPIALERLQEILAEERGRGATLLISTHTLAAIELLATHAAVLLEGRLAASGTVVELQGRYSPAKSLAAIYHAIAREAAVQDPGVVNPDWVVR